VAAVVGSVFLTAGTAQAEIRGTCQGPVCLAANIAGNTVNDATVSTTDGARADLHIYIGNNVDSWQKNSTHFRLDVNRAYDLGTLVCGEAWANGHLLGRPCVRV